MIDAGGVVSDLGREVPLRFYDAFMKRLVIIALLSIALAVSNASAATKSPSKALTTATIGSNQARTFTVVVPKSYNPTTPAPLIVALHGYTSSGQQAQEFFGLQAQAEKRGFITAYPDGTKDANGQPFWNATDSCCNFALLPIDDSAYLISVINDVSKAYAIDPKRVFFIGHSNGGFMSYRMACEHADRIAAIVSVAGETFADPSACTPSKPVSVLQVQGSTDEAIAYAGGKIFRNPYPGAETTVKTWAKYNRCDATSRPGAEGNLDLVASLPGRETGTQAFAGCLAKVGVGLWTIKNGKHSPTFTPTFAKAVVDFFLAHPKA